VIPGFVHVKGAARAGGAFFCAFLRVLPAAVRAGEGRFGEKRVLCVFSAIDFGIEGGSMAHSTHNSSGGE